MAASELGEEDLERIFMTDCVVDTEAIGGPAIWCCTSCTAEDQGFAGKGNMGVQHWTTACLRQTCLPMECQSAQLD